MDLKPKSYTDNAQPQVWSTLPPSHSVASSLSADAIHDQWEKPSVGTFKTGALNANTARTHNKYQLSEEASADSATFSLPYSIPKDADNHSGEILVLDN
jgi:hypothetical protein